MARKRLAQAGRVLASRSMTAREREAATIAQEVYHEVYEWRKEDPDSPSVLAPVSVAARRVAPLALREAGIEETDDNMADAAALIILGFVEAARRLSATEIAAFRSAR